MPISFDIEPLPKISCPHIRPILADEEGNPISGAERLIYRLEGELLETLDQIEQAIPQIEHSLLQRAQQRFLADRGGKQNLLPLALNSKERLRIKTIHGSSEFAQQRFLLPDGSSCRYLERTGQGLHSSGIEEFCLYYCATASVSLK
jgi:hypothetical protein